MAHKTIVYDDSDYEDDQDSFSDNEIESDVYNKPVLNEKISLPVFSKLIEMELKSNDCWTDKSKRTIFIKEIALHCQQNQIKLHKSKDYKTICVLILTKYPRLMQILSAQCERINQQLILDNKSRLKQPWVISFFLLSQIAFNFFSIAVNEQSIIKKNEKYEKLY